MLSFFNYIIPNEWALRLIIILMFVLAVMVIKRMVSIKIMAEENIKTLKKMRDVKYLELTLTKNKVNPEKSFSNYIESLEEINIDSPIVEHLKAIYYAGLKSSRLNSDLLVKNTIDKIFTKVDVLKTGISLFLVIGILGTLVGLAISIGSFTGGNFIMTGAINATANQLTELFGNLKGAFAPSMWGVSFTVLFVLSYSIFIQEGSINKLTEELTENTIRYWVPVLYPTDFQRGDNSVVKLNATIKNAEGINDGVTKLQDNLDETNKTIKALNGVAKTLDSTTKKFEEGTSNILKLNELYNQIKIANDEYKANLENIINADIQERKEGYETINEYIKGQEDYVMNVFKEVEKYNETFNRTSRDLLLKIHTVTEGITASQKNNNEMSQVLSKYASEIISRQDQMTKAIAVPIENMLGKMDNNLNINLNGMKEMLNSNLEEMVKQLTKLENPLVETIKIMQDLTRYATNSFAKSVSDLENLSRKIDERRENYGKNDPVADILKNLDETLEKMNLNIELLIKSNPLVDKKTLEEQKQAMRKHKNIRNRKEAGYIAFVQKNAMPLFIAVVLLISMISQVLMVSKLGNVELKQQEIIKVQNNLTKQTNRSTENKNTEVNKGQNQ